MLGTFVTSFEKKNMKTKLSLFVYFSLIILASSCSKSKQAKEIAGSWTIDSQQTSIGSSPLTTNVCAGISTISGDLILDESGAGSISVYMESCGIKDLIFNKSITDLYYDHDRDGFSNPVHWYHGYFNDDIYMSFENTDRYEKVRESTSSINFNIDGLINQETGGYDEEYHLKLVLNRN